MNPFPLSDSDHARFMSDVGWNALAMLPVWGGIIRWNGRYILVYQRPDSGYSLTDVSGGIPNSGVPGGMIPIEIVMRNVSQEGVSPLGVFIYSLPGNFAAVAKEDLLLAISAGEWAIDQATGLLRHTGAAIGGIVGDTVAGAVNPLGSTIWPIAAIAIAVLAFMYLPKMSHE